MTMKVNDNGISRDMTADEQTAHEAFQAEAAAEKTTETAAAAALIAAKKSAYKKLAALGLTADEIAAL